MKEALSGVKDLALLDPERFDLGEHVVKISGRGLVGAAILRGVDRVEIDGQLLVAEGKAFVVDVRQNRELVVSLQILKRRNSISEDRPVPDRSAVGDAVAPACGDAPLLGQAAING